MTSTEVMEACRLFVDVKDYDFVCWIIEKSIDFNDTYSNSEINEMLGVAIQVASMLDGDQPANKISETLPKCKKFMKI